MKQHNWEPTDNQGYEMICTECETFISIYETKEWNETKDSNCKKQS